MSAPFTLEQSAEIDRRIVEMMTAVMGVGQYSRKCQSIADGRAAALAITVGGGMNDNIAIAATLRECLNQGLLEGLSRSSRAILHRYSRSQGHSTLRGAVALPHGRALPLRPVSERHVELARQVSKPATAAILVVLGYVSAVRLLDRLYAPYSSPVAGSTSTVAEAGGITSAPGGGC